MASVQGLEGLDLSATPYDGCGKCVVAMLRLSQMKDTSNSPEKQVAHNRKVAAANGLHIIAWVEDWDVSGAVNPFVRKGFGPWLRDEMGRYDGIVASAVDRIGRDLLDTLSVGRHMTTTDRLIYTYGHDGPWNLKDELDEQAFTFQALGAQMELRSIQRRTSQTSESMRAQGRKTACLAYGYRYVRIGESRKVDHIEVEEETAGHLRTVVQRILADETDMITPASEARRLTLAGIPTPNDLRRVRQGKEPLGKAWQDTSLREMLISQAALGYLMHDGKPVLDTSEDEQRRGRPIQIAPELWNYATHLALVAKLSPKKVRQAPRAPRSERMAIGISSCGQCGTRLYSGSGGRLADGSYVKTYCCAAKRKGLAECEPGPSITMDKLDRLMAEAFLARFGSLQEYEQAFDAGCDTSARLAEVEAQLSILREDRKAGLYSRQTDAEWFRREYQRLSTEAERLEAEPQRPAHAYWRPTGVTVADRWNATEGNPVARRELMAAHHFRAELFPANASQQVIFHTLDAGPAADARRDSWEAHQAMVEAEAEYRERIEAEQDGAEGIADQNQDTNEDVYIPPTPAELIAEQRADATAELIHVLVA